MRHLHSRIRIATIFFVSNLLPLVAVTLTETYAKVVDEESPVNVPTIANSIASFPDELLVAFEEAGVRVPEPAEPPPAALLPRPTVLPFIKVLQTSQLQNAYLNAFEILSTENSCSRFFGGPAAAHVLNELAQQMKTTKLESKIAVRMNGNITIVRNLHFQISYRMFEKAELNVNGPFFRAHIFPSDPRIPNVGEFRANTPEARTAILLHEVGHLVRRPDKKWVLPDDGRDLALSLTNTDKVLEMCANEIRSVTNRKTK